MFIDSVWKSARVFVPIQLYPLLAPVYRWRRRQQLKALEEDDRRYLALHPDRLAPPAELRYKVLGPCTIEQFITGGEQTVNDIERALQSIGRSLVNVRTFLDFGCGSGRLLLALQRRGSAMSVTGSDVDEQGIWWCRQHLERTTCVVNDDVPPSPFAPESFDLVCCGSVFTHLDEERQDLWLAEMKRILKPGGVLLASVHGPDCWGPRLPPWTVASLKRRGMMFAKTGADAGIHPAWYQVAWHTEPYIREHWAAVLEIRGYLARGFNDYQDLVVAQKN